MPSIYANVAGKLVWSSIVSDYRWFSNIFFCSLVRMHSLESDVFSKQLLIWKYFKFGFVERGSLFLSAIILPNWLMRSVRVLINGVNSLPIDTLKAINTQLLTLAHVPPHFPSEHQWPIVSNAEGIKWNKCLPSEDALKTVANFKLNEFASCSSLQEFAYN